MTRSYHAYAKSPRTFSDARLRYLARSLHGLGENPLFHFLREIAAGADLVEHLERYASLPGDFIKQHDGDKLPELRVINRRRR